MTDATWQEITAEAIRRKAEALKNGRGDVEIEALIVKITREGWKPPEPVDPDVLAWRDWYVKTGRPRENEKLKAQVLRGLWDYMHSCAAYRAGVRMATERERERAKVLVDWVSLHRARDILAKYEESLK